MKCPFADEFGKWISCPHYEERNDDQCAGTGIGHEGDHIGHVDSWCAIMIGRAMLAHKTWIGNDY